MEEVATNKMSATPMKKLFWKMGEFALKHSLIDKKQSKEDLYHTFLSLDASKDALIKQAETIKLIAEKESCVIVGRGADSILKDYPNVIKIFLYAPLDYRIHTIEKLYKDSYKEAKKHVLDSDKLRATYYELVAN